MTYYGKEMENIHPEGCKAMTWEDAEKADKLDADNGWGFSDADLLRLIADHMSAQDDIENGEDIEEAVKTQEIIEWRLNDANFHNLCETLHEHKYSDAVHGIYELMEEC